MKKQLWRDTLPRPVPFFFLEYICHADNGLSLSLAIGTIKKPSERVTQMEHVLLSDFRRAMPSATVVTV
jgi:hypothetical protein